MEQEVTIKKKSDDVIKRQASDQFFSAVEAAIAAGIVKNEREFAMRIQELQVEFSKIKRPGGKRYIDVALVWKAINTFNLNANRIFVEGGDKTEKLQRETIQINGGSAHGNNNVVITGQAVSQHGDVHFNQNVEKLIQSLPKKDKEAILDGVSNLLKDQSVGLNSQIEALKKTIDGYEAEIKRIEKQRKQDQELIETQKKLIAFMEKGGSKKK